MVTFTLEVDMCGAAQTASTLVAVAATSAAAVATLQFTSISAILSSAILAGSAGSSTPVLITGISIIMGAQRLAVSVGLSANVSSTYTSSLRFFEWTVGDLRRRRDASCSDSDPALDVPPTVMQQSQLPQVPPSAPPLSPSGPPMMPPQLPPPPFTQVSPPPPPFLLPLLTCDSLMWVLIALAIAVTASTVLRVIVHSRWKRKLRTHLRKQPVSVADQSFSPYPSGMVFPGVELVVTSLFLTGMVGNAVTVLAKGEGTTCNDWLCSCKLLAIIALVIAVSYLMLAITLLVRFNRTHRSTTWKPNPPITRASQVEDPIFRLMARCRILCHPKRSARHPALVALLNRMRGAFARLANGEQTEPARTARILAHPCAFVRGNVSDFLDAYGFSLMARAAGVTGICVWFELTIIVTQLIVSTLNGLGVGLNLVPGSYAAVAQMVSILLTQWAASLWIICGQSAADRLATIAVGTQFALEGCQTLLLLAYTFNQSPTLENGAFVCALAGLCVPIALLFYDCTILQLSKLVSRGLTWRSVRSSCLSLWCYAPRLVLFLAGIKVDNGVDATVEHAVADLQEMKERTRNARESTQNANQQAPSSSRPPKGPPQATDKFESQAVYARQYLWLNCMSVTSEGEIEVELPDQPSIRTGAPLAKLPADRRWPPKRRAKLEPVPLGYPPMSIEDGSAADVTPQYVKQTGSSSATTSTTSRS